MAQGYAKLRNASGRLDLSGTEFDRLVAHVHRLRLRLMWRLARRLTRSLLGWAGRVSSRKTRGRPIGESV
jgi:hypothetical protein